MNLNLHYVKGELKANFNIGWITLKGFLTSTKVFSRENSTIASGEVNTILFYHRQRIPRLTPDVISFLAHWIFPPKVNRNNHLLHCARKMKITLDNFSLSSQQLVPNYILYPCICPDVHPRGILAHFDQINISPDRSHFLSAWLIR